MFCLKQSRDSAYLEDVFVPSDSQETASRGMLTPAVQPQKRFSSRDGSPLRPSSPLPPYYNSGAGNDELGDYPWYVDGDFHRKFNMHDI